MEKQKRNKFLQPSHPSYLCHGIQQYGTVCIDRAVIGLTTIRPCVDGPQRGDIIQYRLGLPLPFMYVNGPKVHTTRTQ